MTGAGLKAGWSVAIGLLGAWALACGGSARTERVSRVIDGDTVELESGQKVRYLMADTTEISDGKDECYGQEAKTFNVALVEGKQVKLTTDVEPYDAYNRLLAYLEVEGTEVNTLLVERGYACVLYIPPNGEERQVEFMTLQAEARAASRGVWGACDPVPCAQ